MQTNLARKSVLVRDGSQARAWWAVAGVVGFAALTALGAVVRIPLPYTPVPMTLQTLFVLLAGITLGPRLGAASMGCYLLLGATGAHVFAGGESWGLRTLFGPTGGYLLGFVAAQPLVGWFARRHRGSWFDLLTAALVGSAIVYACGLAWLSAWLRVSLGAALTLGLYPFVAGEALKMMLAVGGGRVIVRRIGDWRLGIGD